MTGSTTGDAQLIEALDARARRREERRDFFRTVAGTAALAGGVALASTSSPAQAQATGTDAAVLNFALNLEYLEANFYSFAVFGTPIRTNLTGGTGTRGDATGGRRVNFTDPQVAQYAREIAQDELAHVEYLRLAIGSTAVAQPRIDLGIAPTGAFSTAARAAGLVGAGQSFDPYASDENFLLGAYIFEDVGVTAYKGASPLITNKTFLEAAAGILAVEAYHAALIRTTLYQKGIETPAQVLIEATEQISDARDKLDGTTDLDQGVRPTNNVSNIAPLDANGIAFTRSPFQVLNIAFLTSAAASQGGFFPGGVNGTLRTSGANTPPPPTS